MQDRARRFPSFSGHYGNKCTSNISLAGHSMHKIVLNLRIVRLLTESEVDRMDNSTPSISRISLPNVCWSNSSLPNPIDRRQIPESVCRNPVYRIPIYRSQLTESQFPNQLTEDQLVESSFPNLFTEITPQSHK